MSEAGTAGRVLLAAHGTRSAAGRDCVEQVRAALQARLGREVVLGWVDVCEPVVADLVCDDDLILPAFLGEGYHVRHDVPLAARRAERVRVSPHLGPDELVLDALDARVREAGGPWPVTLFAWAGSSDPRSRAEAERAAQGLAERLPATEVRVVTPAEAVDAVAAARGEGKDVGIASYLLAPGFFHSKLSRAGAEATSDPLGAHPLVVEALARRAAALDPVR